MKVFAALLLAGAMPGCGLLIALLLAGCAAPPPPAPEVVTKTVVERVTLPPGLLTCAPAPQVGIIAMQSQVADYIVRLEEAGADCRDTVAAIATIENAPPAGN